jgi:predicted nucleotide-binding protein
MNMEQEEIIAIVNRQLEGLRQIDSNLSDRLPRWKARTIRLLSGHINDQEIDLIKEANTSSYETDRLAYDDYMVGLLQGLKEFPSAYIANETQTTTAKSLKSSKPTSKKIFVVHGHDETVKIDVARTLEKLGLEPIILHEQPSKGKTIIEKFEEHASLAQYAIVLLTPDDIGYPINKEYDKRPRARQNVILELGYFAGRLGRENICVIYKGNVEVPSDYISVVYIPFDDSGAWRYKIGKELKAVGMTVDLNKLS